MKRSTPHRRSLVLLAAFAAVALVIGLLMFDKYRQRHELPTVQPVPGSAGSFRVTLFFAAPDGEGLAREGRGVPACDQLADCVDAVVDELINGPLGALQPTVPPTTTVRQVRIEGDTAVIDFGRELADGLPGGSSSEMMAVYSVVNTVCFNFPQLKRVRFLLDGAEAESLTGHLDLRQPIDPDYSKERPAEPETRQTQ
ncbi:MULTISPECIES: GerMN domain-containing protein [Geobacter]|uniref:Sporulation protein n=2 Tax=Geobacter TaxID=28231 RepID=A0A0C1U6D1_9BACT|nr:MULTISPECIES: GerMN domain-containing protein [Geobacter]ANA41150.1 sporulation protein [Geobacter anodireducens]KIE43280.1 sporulation protein [Geobacter soli]MBE2889036.1 GerMN domain-containing protein [Geobacter anodireducens]HMN02932.1 GerMN domain-containing protein [Geobacter anodireducens]